MENADSVSDVRVDADLGRDGDDKSLNYQGICSVLVEVLTFLPTCVLYIAY